MDAAAVARESEKANLLARLGELLVEEQRAAGRFDQTPRFSELEDASHALGCEVARASLKRAACEVAAAEETTAGCPRCGRSCRLTAKARTLHGIDGLVEVLEPVGHCPACRRDFFPSA
jgi:hypothetical protein